MRISKQHFFVFISTPKCGTHTIYQMLRDRFPEGLKNHGLHNTRIPQAYRDWPRWTVVRNPFSRAVSLWWSTCRCHPQDRYGAIRGCGAMDDFPRFARWLASLRGNTPHDPLFLSQSEWLEPVQPIQALHLEHLGNELKRMLWWKEGVELPQINTTKEKIKAQSEAEGIDIQRLTWLELCRDEAVQEDIRAWAGLDFHQFGYPLQVG